VSKRYRPSNGDEGMWFMDRFCDRCRRDDAFQRGKGDSCPIAAATMIYEEDDPQYPKEWIEDDDGPRCTAYEPLDEAERITDARQTVLL
jgi:hypothetical protein